MHMIVCIEQIATLAHPACYQRTQGRGALVP
jgi:hypothetical protein